MPRSLEICRTGVLDEGLEEFVPVLSPMRFGNEFLSLRRMILGLDGRSVAYASESFVYLLVEWHAWTIECRRSEAYNPGLCPRGLS
jgi:hypothetical protein